MAILHHYFYASHTEHAPKKKRGKTRRAKHKYTQRTIWKNCQWYLESIVHLIKKKISIEWFYWNVSMLSSIVSSFPFFAPSDSTLVRMIRNMANAAVCMPERGGSTERRNVWYDRSKWLLWGDCSIPAIEHYNMPRYQADTNDWTRYDIDTIYMVRWLY